MNAFKHQWINGKIFVNSQQLTEVTFGAITYIWEHRVTAPSVFTSAILVGTYIYFYNII